VGPAVGKRTELCQDDGHNSVHILAYFSIGKADGLISEVPIDGISPSVSVNVMRVAVDFDDKSLLRTEEVGDAIADDMLSPEFEATKLGTAEMSPKLSFERSRAVAQPPRSLDQVRVLYQALPHPVPLP
jgi:hypothetical protein